jgi:hypothetical protein
LQGKSLIKKKRPSKGASFLSKIFPARLIHLKGASPKSQATNRRVTQSFDFATQFVTQFLGGRNLRRKSV